MKISDSYIGGWFQRTMLQLSEMYDFLRACKTELRLNPKKLNEYRDNLEITNIEYGVSMEEFIYFSTTVGINVKIFEDGLITLNYSDTTENTLFSDVDKVQDYYENRLSPALNYLFSLGAPVPKELVGIKNVYPYFIVCEKATQNQIRDLLAKTEGQEYFEFENDKYLIDARIKQMNTYIPTREKNAKNDVELTEFLEIFGYRYETLRDTLEYVQYLWSMTQNYVAAAQEQFESLKADFTNKSVTSLTIVTSMGAGAASLNYSKSRHRPFPYSACFTSLCWL